MIEDQKDIFKKESEQRAAAALKRRNALKLHQITVTHGVNLDTHTISILGFDSENDINAWKLAANLNSSPKLTKRLTITGQETRCAEINFIPPQVQEVLTWSFVRQMNPEQRKRLFDALKDSFKEEK